MAVEVLKLYDVEGKKRAFDALTDGDEITAGVVTFEPDAFDEPRTYVWVDRKDPLGDSYAMRLGGSTEILGDDRAITDLVTKALTGMPVRSRGPVTAWGADGEIDLSNTTVQIDRREIHE